MTMRFALQEQTQSDRAKSMLSPSAVTGASGRSCCGLNLNNARAISCTGRWKCIRCSVVRIQRNQRRCYGGRHSWRLVDGHVHDRVATKLPQSAAAERTKQRHGHGCAVVPISIDACADDHTSGQNIGRYDAIVDLKPCSDRRCHRRALCVAELMQHCVQCEVHIPDRRASGGRHRVNEVGRQRGDWQGCRNRGPLL